MTILYIPLTEFIASCRVCIIQGPGKLGETVLFWEIREISGNLLNPWECLENINDMESLHYIVCRMDVAWFPCAYIVESTPIHNSFTVWYPRQQTSLSPRWPNVDPAGSTWAQRALLSGILLCFSGLLVDLRLYCLSSIHIYYFAFWFIVYFSISALVDLVLLFVPLAFYWRYLHPLTQSIDTDVQRPFNSVAPPSFSLKRKGVAYRYQATVPSKQ